jgi:hypothetical protein
MADARVALSREQLPGRGGEERPRLLRIDGWGIGDVDHGIDTRQRVCQPTPGRQVHPDRAGDHHRVVPGVSERLDGVATSQSRSTGYRDPHDPTLRSEPVRVPDPSQRCPTLC